jgi:type VI secretion system lysozyme-like protein
VGRDVSTISTDAGFTLLDLLIDENPGSELETRLTDSERERVLRQAVEADIASLLNHRHWLGTWPPDLEALRFSLLNYGLPDLSAAVIDSKPVQSVLIQTVRMVLEVFEPRLSNIKVVFSAGIGERGPQFLVTADVRGSTEPLGFRRPFQRAAAPAKDAPA